MLQLKNKVFVVKVLDDPELNKTQPTPAQIEAAKQNQVDQVGDIGGIIVGGVCLILAAYFGGDTLRQVTIHTAKTLIK